MSALHYKRFFSLLAMLIGFSIAVALILFALNQNINLFYAPDDVQQGLVPFEQKIRMGGMVEPDSVTRQQLSVKFTVTDYKSSTQILFNGILPDLFKEGQGIVALGSLKKDGIFYAEQVLAKHDENYMPPEISATLAKKQ
jgi:cytochrome c-type biogenesis protein CcmE